MFSLCSCFQADVCLIMSKRGRRRSSRRKSSSSNKQSESPFIFLKQNESHSISDKDDITEKGETDSLRKENVSLGSEDDEVYDKTCQKERRFKPESPPNQRSHCSETSDDRGVTVVTSVSINDIATSAPKITFQQSHKPQSQDPSGTPMPLASEVIIKCIGSHIRLEIQENLQVSAPGIKTTFVFMNEKGVCVETSLKSQWERMWTPNNEPPEPTMQSLNGIRQNGTKDTATYNLTLDAHEQNNDSIGEKTWNNSQFALTCQPLIPKPQRKRDTFQKSFSTDHVQQTFPPHNFTAIKYNSLDGLMHQLSSWRIAANEKQRAFYPTPNMVLDEEFGHQTSAHNNKQADVTLCFDYLSGSDHFESLFSRSSSSVNRFSFDFIDTQTRRSWIRNHSIGAVEIKNSLSPQKRRQTFPGLSEDLLVYSPSFSSTVSSFMCSLPVQADGLVGIYHGDDKFPAFGIEGCPSHAKWNYNRHSNTSDCGDIPCNFFTICEQCRRQSKTQTSEDLRQQDLECVRKNADDCREDVDQSEAADAGSERETGEAEPDKHRPLTDEVFGDSENQMSEHYPVVSVTDGLVQNTSIKPESCDGFDKFQPTKTKSSVLTLTAAASEQRFLQKEADKWSENDTRNDLSATLEEPCMPPLLDMHSIHSLNPHEAGEDISSETKAEFTGNVGSSSPSQRNEEAKDLHLEKEEFEKPGSDVSKHSTDHNSNNNKKESLPKMDKNDKQFARKYSSEMKERLKPLIPKNPEGSGPEHWAKRRKLFKDSKQWGSAGGSSVTSDITEESGKSVSEENRSMEMTVGDTEDRGFYTETFHSVSWIYQGDDSSSSTLPPSLSTKPRAASVRERTVRISKGAGEYPWGFRIQFSKPIVVTEVDTNGAAEEAGLMVGDYVLAVNGTDVTTVPHCEAAQLARQGPDVLTLTIGSDIARCPNTPRPACRGYLHKRTQSGLIKGWRKRWFVLTHDCCLYYYRHKGVSRTKTK
ncbi:uncharacterized protein pdzph1 [Thalassophryne amazonica]|uniref:uncharacterized protein pdzph1 n=1 Tax=Thalassophryne amazonica TaxID=390379 RepID=UPI0014725D4F|nr:uncharacterized protein pdzph1 [Thalassophryne amazonica]